MFLLVKLVFALFFFFVGEIIAFIFGDDVCIHPSKDKKHNKERNAMFELLVNDKRDIYRD